MCQQNSAMVGRVLGVEACACGGTGNWRGDRSKAFTSQSAWAHNWSWVFGIRWPAIAFTRVPDGAGRRRKRQKLRENSASETRQAMAVITLARSCPYTSMALALSILRLVATAWTQAGTTPLERVVFESRPGRVSPKYHTGWSDHGGKYKGKDKAEGAFDA